MSNHSCHLCFSSGRCILHAACLSSRCLSHCLLHHQLLLLGLLGRFASVTLFIMMMVAAFVHHFHDPWATRELPLLYAAVFAALAFTGPGSPSFDAWFSRQVFEKEGSTAREPRRAEPGART